MTIREPGRIAQARVSSRLTRGGIWDGFASRGEKTLWKAIWRITVTVALLCGTGLHAQTSRPVAGTATTNPDTNAEAELQTGIMLARQGFLQQAIPHLQIADGHVAEEYAAQFNLALCYVGTGQFDPAIRILTGLRADGRDTAAVNNLLAQAYAGDGNAQAALDALHRAAAQTPKDERLYALVADACTDYKEYDLGLRVVSFGLTQLPKSARLHYERALFLAQLDHFELAKPEFDLASRLEPGSDVAYLALVQKYLYEDKIQDAIVQARQGIAAGHRDYVLLSLLGTVLIQAGAMPGQPEFAEARSALEASVAQHPDYSTAQIALGKVYLMEDRPADAVTHLETGRRLEPRNAAVYASLANAYQRLGERKKAQETLTALGKLVQ
jgi:predicted Zn-dependent protease